MLHVLKDIEDVQCFECSELYPCQPQKERSAFLDNDLCEHLENLWTPQLMLLKRLQYFVALVAVSFMPRSSDAFELLLALCFKPFVFSLPIIASLCLILFPFSSFWNIWLCSYLQGPESCVFVFRRWRKLSLNRTLPCKTKCPWSDHSCVRVFQFSSCFGVVTSLNTSC